MIVLSLFDGISGGQVALNRLKVQYTQYFASEVDPYAIQVTQNNFPNTVQLGDVKDIDLHVLPKVDLLIGGSPCQGFSFAGKQLNFNDERSKLFFEYVRVLNQIKPKYFLLENVVMKKQFKDVISNLVGVEPIEINSCLVSAQNRKRLYWTNIPNITLPKDKNIVIGDIIGTKKIPNQKKIPKAKIVHNIYPKKGQNGNIYSILGKSKTLSAGVGICGIGIGSNNAPKIECNNDKGWRRMSVSECERLQTFPTGYTKGISNTQRYKVLGNAFTVDIIAHILKHMEIK